MDINDILAMTPRDAIRELSTKTIEIPSWALLEKEFDSKKHPVMDKVHYPDKVNEDGSVEHVSRVTSDLIRLAVKRTTELCFGIPVKRICYPTNDKQKEIQTYLENIYRQVRINSINIERGNMLFAGCEVMSLWFAVQEPNNKYGFNSQLKLRVRNFSPMNGDMLYPYFDEFGDLVALSVSYTRKVVDTNVNFYDVYTAERHIKYKQAEQDWLVDEDEQILLGKIPAVYMNRPTPIWENTAEKVYEIEWTLSRNGNYLRRNAKPIFVVYADEEYEHKQERNENSEFRTVLQYPRGSSANYITWSQATESLKYQVDQLKEMFYTQLQIPDLSYDNMKTTPMSGEARKQLFMDCHLKVKDESGRILEFLDRETSVIKAFLKLMLPDDYSADIDALQVENQITPYTISDFYDRISGLTTATKGAQIMSQREAITELGYSNDVDKTMKEIAEDSAADAAEMTL